VAGKRIFPADLAGIRIHISHRAVIIEFGFIGRLALMGGDGLAAFLIAPVIKRSNQAA